MIFQVGMKITGGKYFCDLLWCAKADYQFYVFVFGEHCTCVLFSEILSAFTKTEKGRPIG